MNTVFVVLYIVGGILLGAGGYYLIARITGAGILKKAAEEAEVVKKNKMMMEVLVYKLNI